eukprot:COSAG01_NODE_18858_length_1048_cov_4.199157_3_plen_185_part_00
MRDKGDITEPEFETLIALAKKEIDRHMRVTNVEKVDLFDKYDRAMRYPGHCCAVCGVRDATADYDRIYVDLGNPDLAGYDGQGATRQARVRGDAGVGGGPPVAAVDADTGDGGGADAPPTPPVPFVAVRVQTLPDWLRAEVSISHLSQPRIARLFYNVIVVGPIVFICLCNWCRNGFVGRVAQL